jgi:hypothetical protein
MEMTIQALIDDELEKIVDQINEVIEEAFEREVKKKE